MARGVTHRREHVLPIQQKLGECDELVEGVRNIPGLGMHAHVARAGDMQDFGSKVLHQISDLAIVQPESEVMAVPPVEWSVNNPRGNCRRVMQPSVTMCLLGPAWTIRNGMPRAFANASKCRLVLATPSTSL